MRVRYPSLGNHLVQINTAVISLSTIPFTERSMCIYTTEFEKNPRRRPMRIILAMMIKDIMENIDDALIKTIVKNARRERKQ